MGVDATKPSVLDSTGATSGRGRAPARAELSQGVLGWLFVAPIVVVIVVLVGYPLLVALQMSAQDVAIYPGEQTKWVGLDNYRSLLSADSTLSAAIHTLGYWLIAVSVELGIGMAAALALWHPFRGRGVVLALLVLPWALPPVVSGLLWTRIFDPTSGWLNGVLYQLGVIDHYRIWFSDPGSTIGLVALVHAWGLVPLVTLILLGGLQGIPSELFEAAHIDGASRVSAFRYITRAPLAGVDRRRTRHRDRGRVRDLRRHLRPRRHRPRRAVGDDADLPHDVREPRLRPRRGAGGHAVPRLDPHLRRCTSREPRGRSS